MSVIRCDALVVGGGPAGSTCARLLHGAGWNVIVADRARFPRNKVCAGWLTPDVFPLLDLPPHEYRSAGLTLQEIRAFRTGVMGRPLVRTEYGRTVSYAIRRCEFDDFLLRRSGARVLEGAPVGSFERRGSLWLVDGAIETPIVIGAGGHFCPVARHLRRGRDASQPVVAREAEVRLDRSAAPIEGDTPELYFSRDLEGYAWCVRKGEFVNVGIGRRDARDFNRHLRTFAAFLERQEIVRDAGDLPWQGHAYFADGVGTRPLAADGMLLVGDSAGLAYPESGEGIKPAIESGRRAARALIAADGGPDEAARLYTSGMTAAHPAARRHPAALRPLVVAAGRALMRSPLFTRRVLLDRWFLRTTAPAGPTGA